jgi:glycosyltransferase involved in cell wall biosynthesis
MNRLLAVSWEMPPLSGPRAVQVTRTLLHLAPLGWASTVVCFGPRSARYNSDFTIDPERLSGGDVRLVRVASPEEWFPVRALWRICPPLKHLPDEKRVWLGRALAAARRELTADRFSALVSFGQPWSDHLVALRLRRETAIPWIAHFSDPWVGNPYARLAAWQRRVWERMERDVVAAADRVVFLNQQTADHTMRRYPPEWRAKMAIVPQGFDAAIAAPPGRTSGPLRIVYTGRFYDGIRTPQPLIDALSRLTPASLAGRLIVDVYGRPFAPYARRAKAAGLGDIVRFHGRVPPDAAARATADADVLLVIDGPSDGASLFLPSKLVDYLPLGAPILGITPTEGAAADLIRDAGYPVVDPRDVPGIARAVEALLAAHAAGTLTASARHRDAARRYDIRETTKLFARVLDELAPGRAGAA